MAAIASATSGMRATSAFANTMAVIIEVKISLRDHRPVGRTVVQRAEPFVEQDQRGAGLLDGVVHREVPRGTPDGAGPLALHVHSRTPRSLQPAQDPLGLLGAGGRRTGRPTDHRSGGARSS